MGQGRVSVGALGAITLLLSACAGQPVGGCQQLCEPDFWQSAGLAEIQAELASGSSPNARSEAGYSVLQYAAALSDDPAEIRYLIEQGADPDTPSWLGLSPLHMAVLFNDDVEIARVLLDAGADIEAKDKERGGTPLHHAGRKRNPAMYELLLAEGAEIGANDVAYGKPIHWVGYAEDGFFPRLFAESPPFDIAEIEGADPSYSPTHGERGREVVALLLAAGSEINARNWQRVTPLHYTLTYERDPRFVEFLLDQGADVQSTAYEGRTPLHQAAAFSPNPEIVQLLIDRGADVMAEAKNGLTPLHWAADASSVPEIISVLVANGADISANAGEYGPPLNWAAALNDDPRIAVALIEAGANVNYRYGRRDYAPLHLSTLMNHNTSVMNALLDHGAEIDLRYDTGGTALHLAAAYAMGPEEIDLLLDRGADATIEDRHGANAYDSGTFNADIDGTAVLERLRTAAAGP